MIYLLWATARPKVMRQTHDEWIRKAVNPENIKTLVAVDTPEHASQIREFTANIVKNPRKGITKPLHYLTNSLTVDDKDIIVVPSDDFYPPDNWDTYLIEKEFDCLQVNDGHQAAIISMPVMTFGCLLKLNRTIYNPVYNHMFSDQELFDVVTKLDILTVEDSDDFIFEHKNPAFGGVKKDAVNNAVNLAFFQMKKLYKRRRSLPVLEKLKGFKLSILICSLHERAESREKLLKVLEPQLNGQTEIILSIDDKDISIGKKRNELLEMAVGEYVLFMDDDDMIPNYCIKRYFEEMEHNPDAIGITVEMTTNGKHPEMGYCSVKNKKWTTSDINGKKVYYRPIHHLCPVKRELALQAKFTDVNSGEDRDYSLQLMPLLKTERVIEDVMYFYQFKTGKPKTKSKGSVIRRIV